MSNTISKTKSIQINETEVVIKKVPLRKVISLVDDIAHMEEFSKLDVMKDKDFVSSLPTLIGTSFPKFADFIAKAINQEGITGDWLLDNVAVDEAIDIVEAIIEVNNVQKIVDKVKKVQALAPKKPEIAPTATEEAGATPSQ